MLAAVLAVSGVQGIVLRGPTKPTCSMTEPCDEPARGLELSFVRSGHVVARVRVDARGHYRVLLAPGRYVVRGAQPSALVVRRGVVARRDLFVDTGIR